MRLQRVLVLALAAFALTFFWSEAARLTFRLPVTGATVRPEASGYRVVAVTKGGAAARAGLRPGDFAPDDGPGVQGSDVLFSRFPYPASRLRDVTLVVRRGGAFKRITVSPATTRESPLVAVRIVARLLSYTAFVVIGAWIVFVRPNVMTWLLFAFCISTVAPGGDLRGLVDSNIGEGTTPDLIITLIICAFIAVPQGLLPLFALRFPNNVVDGWRAKIYRPATAIALMYVVASWIVLAFFLDRRLRFDYRLVRFTAVVVGNFHYRYNVRAIARGRSSKT